jgi:hypothetical protein
MVRLATVCLLFVVVSFACANANAQENQTNLNPLRLEFSFSQTSAGAKQADNEIGTKSSDRFATLTYHFKKQLFGEIGYGRPRTHNISINGQTFLRQANKKTALALYGLGFRSYRKGSNGEYLGIAIRFTSDFSSESESKSTQIIRLFTQKDTRSRYGVIQLSRANGEAGEISKLGGRHVWFNNNGVGFGFQWAFGIGREVDEAGLETQYRSRDAGIIIMYRPTLMNNGYIEELPDESTESPFNESADENYIDNSENQNCNAPEDPFCESDESSLTESDGNPFAESIEELIVESNEDPSFESDENPFAESIEDPFCDSASNPFCESVEESIVE